MDKFKIFKTFLLFLSILSIAFGINSGIFLITSGNIYFIIPCALFFAIPLFSNIFIKEFENKYRK